MKGCNRSKVKFMCDEILYFEIKGYIKATGINDGLDKLIDMCSNHDLVRERIEIMDPLSGNVGSTVIETGSEEKKP